MLRKSSISFKYYLNVNQCVDNISRIGFNSRAMIVDAYMVEFHKVCFGGF